VRVELGSLRRFCCGEQERPLPDDLGRVMIHLVVWWKFLSIINGRVIITRLLILLSFFLVAPLGLPVGRVN
jgi:hypothetical protein